MADEKPVIKIQLSRPDAIFPTKGHPTDAGYDLTIVEKLSKLSENVYLFDTGVRVAPPSGYHVEIVPRSSISKTGWMLANSIGIIDESYRGSIMIALRRIDHKAPFPPLPSRVAQMIVRKTEDVELELVDELSTTERGEGGFGSTGGR
jgi:dUTP pyrophosphatase